MMKNLMKLGFILIGIVVISLSGCMGKDHMPKPKKGDFNGRVVDQQTGEGVVGVKVDFGGGYQTVTDVQGYFCFSILPPGVYQASFKNSWYNNLNLSINHVGKKDRKIFLISPVAFPGTIIYSSYRNANNKRDIFFIHSKNRQSPASIETSGLSETCPVYLKDKMYLFQAENNGNDHIFLGDYTNKRIVAVVNSSGKDQHPSVTAIGDSCQMVFKSNQKSGKYQLLLYDFDSQFPAAGNATELLNEKNAFINGDYPVVDQNGRRIAYVNGKDQLLIYDIDTKIETIINHSGHFSNPSWSPDGTKIAVEWWENSKDLHVIKVYDLLDGSLRQVTFSLADYDVHRHPCWSGDGTILFFSANIAYKSRADVYAIRLDDGLNLANQAEIMMISGGTGSKEYPAWASVEF